MNAERCIICGEEIPEGRQVCIVCEKIADENAVKIGMIMQSKNEQNEEMKNGSQM